MEAKDLLEFVRQRDPTCANAIEFYIEHFEMFFGEETPSSGSIRIPFNDWWDLYAKKCDRAKCERKYKKLTDLETQQVYQHTKEYVESIREKEYQRLPATYLNNRNWEDEGFIEDVQRRSGRNLREGGLTPEGVDRILHK